MPKRNADPEQLTHLGWQSPASAGQGDQDHLWLQDPWPGSSADGAQAQEPILQFLEPVLGSKPEEEEEESAGILFQEVCDSPVEAAAVLWSGDDGGSSALAEPVVFGERDEATVFS
ncbi:MAG: hypothetical protein FJ070_04425 [Cyanobacteria bacterium K_DeepCast_150m_m2_101]|nr:hypothetical protein [Cyanobacteria bacterium K_DeepCast_0m_m1_088]MBM5819323.1 hypothetical protein [Cyanobacteria bacterium K_DeepCast_150m_m2_101]